ncbi:MAG: hypothetical protein PHN37_02320 [Candidatus Pacebacteria bacterium]|nr:hypothetical protein [Candidatus Paceibacterota bacterium]
MINILPCITTTHNSSWEKKIKNTKLKTVAIFLTCLKDRNEFYSLLKKSSIKNIPFIHIRGDMKTKELDFFVEKYNTKAFNLHSEKEYPILYDYSKYKDIIFLENVYTVWDEKEIKNFGGICLDLAHLENDRLLNKNRFSKNKKIIEKYKIGCNHISAIKKDKRIDEKGHQRYDYHYLDNLSELDYLKKYPLNYFSKYIAIELENNLKEQIKIKKYILKNVFHC